MNAFFDESGTHDDSPVMSIGGYLFESEKLNEFNRKWTVALKAKGLLCFHMVDCAHGNEEFANLSRTERIELATILIGLIKTYAERGIGCVLSNGLYEDLMPLHPNMGSSYTYCLFHCLQGARLWREEAEFDGEIAYVFESGHKSQSEANRIMAFSFGTEANRTTHGYASHTFAEKKKFPALQAADIQAWQLCTDWKHGRDGLPRRKDFASMVEQKDHRVTLINAESILSHVREMTAMRAWD